MISGAMPFSYRDTAWIICLIANSTPRTTTASFFIMSLTTRNLATDFSRAKYINITEKNTKKITRKTKCLVGNIIFIEVSMKTRIKIIF